MNKEPTLPAEMIEQMRKRFEDQMWAIIRGGYAATEGNSSLRFEHGRFVSSTEQKRCCYGTIIHAPNCKT